jgi:hypothetical protein
MTEKELKAQIRKFDRKLKRGDTIIMKYDGAEIARYEFVERTIDSKTPMDWLVGNLCFLIEFKNRDVGRVSLEFVPS